MRIKDIRDAYSSGKKEEDKGDLWLYYVVRRISFYPTWLFLRLGISANQATYISIVIGVIGCGLLAFGDYNVRVVGALLANSWIILDCVDGNISRFKKTSSHYGELIDAISGYLMNGYLFLSVGIGACIHIEPSFGLVSQFFHINLNESILIILGAWASLAIILPRLIYQKFMNTFPEARNAGIKPGAKHSKGAYHLGYRVIHNVTSFSGFLTPLLLFASIFELLSVFTLFYALLNTGVLIITTGRIILNGRC
ncbi:CDP-alcohol phosphatidyltransferase family protein [Candidatus Bipolaricaulota bacterium]